MDVLYILKSDHDVIRSCFHKLESAVEGSGERRQLLEELIRIVQLHLLLEKDYLYPEIRGLFSGSEILVDTGLASLVVVHKRLKALTKAALKPAAEQEDLGGCLAEFKESVLKHLDDEERGLMPKLRYMIRTEDREDLGQVLLDVKDEAANGLETLSQTQVAVSRKRA